MSKIKTTKNKIIDCFGKEVVWKTFRFKGMRGWRADEMREGLKTKYYISHMEKIIGALNADGTFALWRDSSLHNLKGWSLLQVVRFVFLHTQKPRK